MEEQNCGGIAMGKHLVYMSKQRDEILRQIGINAEKKGTISGRRSAMINQYSGRNDDFHEQTKKIMKYYEATNMLPQNPCVETYFGTGGNCVLGQASDWIMRLFEPNKLLLIC